MSQLTDPQLRAVFSMINRKMDTLIASNEFTTAQYEEVMARLAASEEKNKELRTMVEAQAQQIARLEVRFNVQDQATKDDQIEIHGVEKLKGENMDDLQNRVKTIFKAWSLESTNISKAHRLNSRNENAPPILVKFSTVMSRNKVLQQFKKVSNRSQGLIFPNAQDKDKKLFIGESLNFYYKRLLYNTRAYAKDKNYKFTWVTEGKIFVRKSEGARAIRISSMKDIETLLV